MVFNSFLLFFFEDVKIRPKYFLSQSADSLLHTNSDSKIERGDEEEGTSQREDRRRREQSELRGRLLPALRDGGGDASPGDSGS
jgi:hypothetical protein